MKRFLFLSSIFLLAVSLYSASGQVGSSKGAAGSVAKGAAASKKQEEKISSQIKETVKIDIVGGEAAKQAVANTGIPGFSIKPKDSTKTKALRLGDGSSKPVSPDSTQKKKPDLSLKEIKLLPLDSLAQNAAPDSLSKH